MVFASTFAQIVSENFSFLTCLYNHPTAFEQIYNRDSYFVDDKQISFFAGSDEHSFIKKKMSLLLFLQVFLISTRGNRRKFFFIVFVNNKVIIGNIISKNFVQE